MEFLASFLDRHSVLQMRIREPAKLEVVRVVRAGSDRNSVLIIGSVTSQKNSCAYLHNMYYNFCLSCIVEIHITCISNIKHIKKVQVYDDIYAHKQCCYAEMIVTFLDGAMVALHDQSSVRKGSKCCNQVQICSNES